jgi:hypothetical protein
MVEYKEYSKDLVSIVKEITGIKLKTLEKKFDENMVEELKL